MHLRINFDYLNVKFVTQKNYTFTMLTHISFEHFFSK